MSGAALLGGLLAGSLSIGLSLVAVRLPRPGRSDLIARVEPYLDRVPSDAHRRAVGSGSGDLTETVQRGMRRAGQLVDRLLGGSESVAARLQRAGLPPDVEGFRIQQVLWGAAAVVVTVLLGSLAVWTRGVGLPALAIVALSAALGGMLLRDQLLSRAASQRERRIMAEFPALAELLALSVTAGEGTTQALDRVARLSHGELAGELELCLAQARTGATMAEALGNMGTRTGLSPIVRFVDGLVVAIERGTPLGEVLRAQAQDAREAARQELIEEGGRREILMMIPVVFLVLPVTVLFAVFPGASLLRLTV
ncbi:type II secretion system F family protein [Ornithinimicrobium cryptoxanthini]|uniref:Type II secretion system F family protein n=1 Tax=Ornithinimicrobium cryptoxanthini TaxID=2934161 RepID=A0ABY4YEY1_9MICO|nr:type II secretion system F family protein [Ornithinimicrobium cryptoxanthini]USQ75322.1 type II secretion system F family protein [Ornithinimicrobium cryptoxanthini]